MKKGKKKKILLGYDNFCELIEKNGYYVDKTLLIQELIDRSSKISLITRPRRFGKTLNLSMLRYFWEIPECRVNEINMNRDMSHLFKDLSILNCGKEYQEQQGKFPVIFFSFRKAKQDSWEETEWSIKNEIAREFKRHSYILEGELLTKKIKKNYEKLMDQEGTLIEYSEGITLLSEHIGRYFKQKPIVLIDEYDTPIQKGDLKNYYAPVINFFQSFLVSGLKSNDYLERAVLTGIMQVAQESIFSAFNNPSVSTITKKAYSNKFGFTQPEVRQMLEYYGYDDHFQEVKKWYNGYIFGNTHDIYNPWSILNFIKEEADSFEPYWLNTSDNQLIKKVLQLDKKKNKETLERLLRGEEVIEFLMESVIYKNIAKTPEAAWNFLLHSGYLKAYDSKKQSDRKQYKLAIPNREIRIVYRNMLRYWFEEDLPINRDLEEITRGLKEADWALFEIHLSRILLKNASYYDLQAPERNLLPDEMEEEKKENFYHGLMLGLMIHLTEEYRVESNREYGNGRPDMVILPEKKDRTAFVMEFKAIKSAEKATSEEGAREAMIQIEEKRYVEGIRAAGFVRVTAIGIGFKGKEVVIDLREDEE